jgi:hypothetical protein
MRTITLKDREILIDDDIFPYILNYSINKNRYVVASILGENGKLRRVYLHRFALDFPDGIIDHKNRNTLDNRVCNLRIATHSQNNANSIIDKTNTSGFKGVSFDGKRWRAQIRCMGQYKSKYFKTPEAAARQYDVWAAEFWGEFAWLNFEESRPKPKSTVYRGKLRREEDLDDL